MPLPPHRPRAAVFHPSFRAFAGAEMVAAWTLQALNSAHEVALWSEFVPDWKRVDERFGTCLSRQPPQLLRPSLLCRCLSNHARLLRESLVQRQLQAFNRRHAPVLWIGTYNESWLPAPGILYINHPERMRLPLPPPHWSRWRQSLHTNVQRTSRRLGLNKSVPPEGHYRLANSEWTRQTYATVSGLAKEVVYPPVPPFAPGLPWSQRENRVVTLGRWAGVKRLPLAIEIVSGLRQAGVPAKLALAGFWHCSSTERHQIEAAARGCEWIEWHEARSRAEIETLAGCSRYGLHTMECEHFGIAVAELASAGCIVAVPASGGPPEIVAEPRQIYRDTADAIAKFMRIAHSHELQSELHAQARNRALRFRPEVFMHRIQQIAANVFKPLL